MRVKLWGTRGSIAAAGPETTRYGGNTSCVALHGDEGTVLVLDAGTGIRRLGTSLLGAVKRVDVLLSHLHMDHIQGLGFFAPLYVPGMEVHLWGPASARASLRDRLMRYLSPPLFPVHLRDLPCELFLHTVPDEFEIGEFRVRAETVCHPAPTVGYAVTTRRHRVSYLPDHELALGSVRFPREPTWTSGYDIARGADLLIHDAQYTPEEYRERVGWGHSTIEHAFAFADMCEVGHLVPFHHDPGHDDAALDQLFGEAITDLRPHFRVTPATEGLEIEL